MKRSIALDIVIIIIGAALCACALDIFVIPNNFSPGGISGLALVVAHYIPLPIGTITFMINLPLLLTAFRILGFRQLAKTLIATALLSAFTDLFAMFLPCYTSNPLLAAVLGGLLLGVGIGFLFLRGISTGGTDLLSILLVHRFPNLPVGTLLLLSDTFVVLVTVIAFKDIEIALYSMIIIWVNGRVVDAIMDGANYAKVIYIVTEHGEALTKALTENTNRGVTIFPVIGGYTGNSKNVIMTVTRKNVLSQTLFLIKSVDPRSFTFVTDAAEVHGEGFKKYHADITPDNG